MPFFFDANPQYSQLTGFLWLYIFCFDVFSSSNLFYHGYHGRLYEDHHEDYHGLLLGWWLCLPVFLFGFVLIPKNNLFCHSYHGRLDEDHYEDHHGLLLAWWLCLPVFFWTLFEFSAIQITCCWIVHSCKNNCSASTQLALACNLFLRFIASSLLMLSSLMVWKIFWHMLWWLVPRTQSTCLHLLSPGALWQM